MYMSLDPGSNDTPAPPLLVSCLRQRLLLKEFANRYENRG
ncbi:unnamed protein product [Brassica oleracea var. botrytis]